MASSVQRAIKIFARVKPTNGRPCATYDIIGADNNDEEYLTVAVKQNPEDGYINNKPEQHSFRFSKIFDRQILQDQVFLEVAKPVIDSALLGYNGTIFAYGQTGTGKTFTMTGSRSEYDKRGIIPRSLSYIFRRFQEEQDGTKIRAAFVSYLEIYNEGGYDLLHSSDMAGRLEDLGKVTMLEDGHQQMHLRNLSVHPISSEEEALQLLYLGDHNRTVAETPLNEASTRSHCIFTIHLNVREANTSLVRRSKLHLVDLAGSERVSNSPISGQLLTEARHINLALHYLEQVIVALSDSNRQHIPYRNSMMTSVLRDSLGGNCMTSMIATLSMEQRNVMESLSTCRFSQRVAMVTNAAMPNEELDPSLMIQQLKAEVKKLREVIAYSSVTASNENQQPISQEEYRDCCALVDRFLLDTDSNAVLPVIPDMRLIQTCFRLIKSAYTARKLKMLGLPLNPNQNHNSNISINEAVNNRPVSDSGASATSVTGSFANQIASAASRPRTEMSPQELLQTINRRDIEIKVLVEMLRKEKVKRGIGTRESTILSSSTDLAALCKTPDKEFTAGENSAADFQYNGQGATDASAVCEDDTSEMSEVKKLALGEFLELYEGRGKLEAVRTEILKRREEVASLEQTINSNEVNMGSLSDIYNRTKADGLNKDSENLKNALESQERTYMMQTKRLQIAKMELDSKHETLKVMYRQLMTEFENWWQHTAKYKPSCEKSGSGSTMQMVTNAFKKQEVETKMYLPTMAMSDSETSRTMEIPDTLWLSDLSLSSSVEFGGYGENDRLQQYQQQQQQQPLVLTAPSATPYGPPPSRSCSEIEVDDSQNYFGGGPGPGLDPANGSASNIPSSIYFHSQSEGPGQRQGAGYDTEVQSPSPPQPQARGHRRQFKSKTNKNDHYEKGGGGGYGANGSVSDESDTDTPSIPLTGDPATDNEILKFYRARKKAASKMKHATETTAS